MTYDIIYDIIWNNLPDGKQQNVFNLIKVAYDVNPIFQFKWLIMSGFLRARGSVSDIMISQ
jgi:hypothetical protein